MSRRIDHMEDGIDETRRAELRDDKDVVVRKLSVARKVTFKPAIRVQGKVSALELIGRCDDEESRPERGK